MVDAGEEETVRIDLYRFVDISVPGTYTVSVTLIPSEIGNVTGSVTSNKITVEVPDVNYPNLADNPASLK
jgi:hypothetical protein